MKQIMMHGCLLIFSVLVILLIGENHAAKYGNALLKEYHTLPYGLKLTYANIYIIVDQDRWSYLSETSRYSEMVPIVDSIVGYSVNTNKLSLYIYTKNKPLQLDFTSYDMVLNKTPIINNFHLYDENTIFFRKNEPIVIYYWRAIAFVLILIVGVMSIWLVFHILRFFVKKIFKNV